MAAALVGETHHGTRVRMGDRAWDMGGRERREGGSPPVQRRDHHPRHGTVRGNQPLPEMTKTLIIAALSLTVWVLLGVSIVLAATQ